MADPSIAQLMQLPGATPQASPLSPTNPVQPQAGMSSDPSIVQSLLSASQLGQKTYADTLQQMQQRQQYADALRQYQNTLQSQAPKPFSGFSYESPKGKGVLGGIGAVLGDIGKGAVEGLSYTAPGRAVVKSQYERASEPWKEREALTAKQIADIQEQQKTSEGILGSASQLQYRPITAGAQLERSGAAMLTAQNKALHDRAMEHLDAQGQQIKQRLGQGKLTVEQARTQAMMLIARNHDATITNVAGMTTDQRDRDAQIQAFENEYKNSTDHWLQNLLGTAPTPPSQQPTPPKGPTARGSKAGASPNAKPTGGGKPNAQPQRFTVGQKVTVRGKPMTVTAVHPDGSFDAK